MSDAYRSSGVDIDAGDEAVKRIKKLVGRTSRPEVMGSIGGFSGLFALKSYREPILVSSTDGVGTKLKIAFALNRHNTVGIDCVAMCVNDILVQGAEPLFFLDYLATGKLNPIQVEAVVSGIADGCEQAGCALVGGETAEMPGFYLKGEYDIAGFTVGVVEKKRLIDGTRIKSDDAIIGLKSNGIHSNGYSLIRKIIVDNNLSLFDRIPEFKSKLGDELMKPTRIYVKSFLQLQKKYAIKGAAHITGGGLAENIPRVLPEGLNVEIDESSWETPPVFRWLEKKGRLKKKDLYRTFNMGIGFAIIVAPEDVNGVISLVNKLGEEAMHIGKVVAGNGKKCLIGKGLLT